MPKFPSYKRGTYKPRTKPDPRKGNLKEGSINWLVREYGWTYHQAREFRKGLKRNENN